MSEKPPDGAPASGGTPPANADEKRLELIEKKQSEAHLVALKAKLDALEAKESARAASETAAAKKATEVHVDHLIATGYVRDSDRDDAIWAFTADPERAKRIYATQQVPIGSTQAGPNAGAPAAPAAHKVVDFDKASEADLLAHERPVFESQLLACGDRKKALKNVLSNREMIARGARKLGLTG